MTLRVLTLSTLYPDSTRPTFGGFVERQTRALAQCQDTEVRVVAPIGLPLWPLRQLGRYAKFSRLPSQDQWNGLSITRPLFLHWPRTGGRFDVTALSRALLPLLTDLRRSFPFDVIDAEFFFPDGPSAVQIGKALGVPVSIKSRGSDIAYWARQPLPSRQIISAAKSADGLLTVSAALKRDMVSLGMPESRITVHYTGVDQEIFKPVDRTHEKASRGIAGPLIAGVGTLNANKGHALTIEALAAIPDAHLVLIGKGPDEAELRKCAQRFGVEDRVTHTGAIPLDEVARWVATADVMALPSASEGLANAWIEALSCGTPVVTCDVGGAREVITSDQLGLLVEREPAAISAGITRILAQPPAQATLRTSVSQFTWERNAASLRAHLIGLTQN